MRRHLLLIALVALAAGETSARKPKAPARASTFSVRAKISATGGAAAVAAKIVAAGDRVVVAGDDLALGGLAESAAWTRAVDLVARQPWTAHGVVIDAVRVVESEPDGSASQRDANIPVVAELARLTGARAGRRLVTRASAYAFPDFALPPAAEEIANLAPLMPTGKAKGKPKPNLAVLVLGERELCDSSGSECLAWLRVLAPARGAGVLAAWVPLNQLWVPETTGEFQLRRLGRGPGGTTWDALSRRGARTFCTVPDGAAPPVRAVRGNKKETAVLRDAQGRPVGKCDDEALSPG